MSTMLKKFIELIRSQTNEQLIELARLANKDMSDEADMIIDALTSELQSRLPENEFIALCDELENIC